MASILKLILHMYVSSSHVRITVDSMHRKAWTYLITVDVVLSHATPCLCNQRRRTTISSQKLRCVRSPSRNNQPLSSASICNLQMMSCGRNNQPISKQSLITESQHQPIAWSRPQTLVPVRRLRSAAWGTALSRGGTLSPGTAIQASSPATDASAAAKKPNFSHRGRWMKSPVGDVVTLL